MRRNMDLVRTILLWIEESPSGWSPPPVSITFVPPEQVSYHAHIMREDGLLETTDPTHSANPVYLLTWKGHEFLDLARDPNRWDRAKNIIGKVGAAPISVWTKILQDLVLKELDVASKS